MESVPIVAVPVRVMTQEVRPGPVALPFARQLIEVGEANVPSAAPVNFRSPAQLALNEPLAAVVVCTVTFHLKSVQVLGDGIRLEDVQLPSSELLPASLGPVEELRRSKAVQPMATLAVNAITIVWIRFFIICISASVFVICREPPAFASAIFTCQLSAAPGPRNRVEGARSIPPGFAGFSWAVFPVELGGGVKTGRRRSISQSADGVHDTAEVILERLARAAECQLVPWNLIPAEEARFQ